MAKMLQTYWCLIEMANIVTSEVSACDLKEIADKIILVAFAVDIRKTSSKLNSTSRTTQAPPLRPQ